MLNDLKDYIAKWWDENKDKPLLEKPFFYGMGLLILWMVVYGAIKSKIILAIVIIFIILNRRDIKYIWYELIYKKKGERWLSKEVQEWDKDPIKDDPTYDEKSSNHPLADETYFEWRLNQPEYNPNDEIYDDCTNCDECESRNGKVKSYKEWEAIGVPMSKMLPCGDDCSCGMRLVDNPNSTS